MKKITLFFTFILAYSLNVNSQILTESFDDVSTLTDWDQVNVSETIGVSEWFQGNPDVIVAQAGADNSYIGANYNSTTDANDISNWLILPVLSLKDGDILTFYTRTSTGSIYPDRMQVRVSAEGAASTAPDSPTDLGSYTTLLLDINPNLTVGGYPNLDWELQTVTISGLGATAIDARLAFRYLVADGGPNGTNSNYIGIDTLEITEGTLNVNQFAVNAFSHSFNKTTDLLSLNSNEAILESVKIHNILGQNVLNKTLASTNEVVDMSSMQDGIYLVTVAINESSKTFKILKN